MGWIRLEEVHQERFGRSRHSTEAVAVQQIDKVRTALQRRAVGLS